MSSQPPPSQSPPPPAYGGFTAGPGSPQLPTINGEFVVFVLVWAVLGIITLASDAVGAGQLVTATVALAVAYLLSRGIAKAGKVVEGR